MRLLDEGVDQFDIGLQLQHLQYQTQKFGGPVRGTVRAPHIGQRRRCPLQYVHGRQTEALFLPKATVVYLLSGDVFH